MKPTFPAGRCLHLVDVENLIHDPRPSREQTVECRRRFEAAASIRSGDHTVLACNHGAGGVVAFAWPGVRHLFRSGRDGADLALLEVIEREDVVNRFDRVVIASGDGIFADPAASLAAAGVEVTVVSDRRSLSNRLRLAASRVVLLDPPLPPAGEIAPVVDLRAA